MRPVLVCGSRDGVPMTPVLVTFFEFITAWGRFAPYILYARRDRPFCVDGRCVWLEAAA